MSGHDDTRDRLIALEVKVAHLTAVADRQARKIDEMYEMMMRGKGAWWVVVGAAGFVGFLLSLGVKFLPWWGALPK